MKNNSQHSSLLADYFTLCKPKVLLVMLVTTWVGMHLATNTLVPWDVFIFGTLGIALAGGSAAVINHLVDRHIDAKMTRTENRPMANKRIPIQNATIFSAILGVSGLLILAVFINFLTAYLTFATVLGYAVLYTLFLKRQTPQNIVIGGAAGAMPPLLGWTAVTGHTSAFAWLLVLIIFTWTPPHFWALAIHRKSDYENANIPMLPNTHGISFTKLYIVLYTLLLFAVTLLPYAAHMAGGIYFGAASLLGTLFLIQTLILYRTKSTRAALKTFSFSILYLLLLFSALLIDHYIQLPLETFT
jgi:protoheme IX farnesyltransferase